MNFNVINLINSLWVERYRPQILNNLLCGKQVKDYCENARLTQTIQNILLTGKPGCGKTTLAKIIVNDILKCDYLYINASDENGIDTIRIKIQQFVMTKSIDGRLKVVVLDESDGLAGTAQRALRNLMEEYSEYARFILTGNEKHRIIPAIQSRCISFDLTYTLSEVGEYCKHILENEHIVLDTNEKKKEFCNIIKDCAGDIRKTINSLQLHCRKGNFEILIDNDISIDNIILEVIGMIQNNQPLQLRQYTIKHESEFNGDYQTLLKRLLNFVFDSKNLDEKTKVTWCKTITEFYYRSSIVIDQEINWFACILNLCK
nr:MAG TPA: activator clamp loader [Caudoviricetes sp.]